MSSPAPTSTEYTSFAGLPLDDAHEFRSYWEQTRCPLVSMIFIAPLLVIYEGGLLWLGTGQAGVLGQTRNGAEIWLRQVLGGAGLGHYFLLPVLTCGILLAWKYLSHTPWRVRVRILPGMLLESVVLALALLLVAQLHRVAFEVCGALASCVADVGGPAAQSVTVQDYLGRVVACCGAGLYEELLFRLVLLSAIIGVLWLIGIRSLWGYAGAAVAASLVFSLAHYPVFATTGEPFEWFTFVFRLNAGMLFCAIFLLRGFGIAVVTHALYNLLAMVF